MTVPLSLMERIGATENDAAMARVSSDIRISPPLRLLSGFATLPVPGHRLLCLRQHHRQHSPGCRQTFGDRNYQNRPLLRGKTGFSRQYPPRPRNPVQNPPEPSRARRRPRCSLKDPRLQSGLLTITHVDTTSDLRYSKIYVSALDKSQRRLPGWSWVTHRPLI